MEQYHKSAEARYLYSEMCQYAFVWLCLLLYHVPRYQDPHIENGETKVEYDTEKNPFYCSFSLVVWSKYQSAHCT